MEASFPPHGIARVLSEARASLSKPSRPFTPNTSRRQLFAGEDRVKAPPSPPNSSSSSVPVVYHDSKPVVQKEDREEELDADKVDATLQGERVSEGQVDSARTIVEESVQVLMNADNVGTEQLEMTAIQMIKQLDRSTLEASPEMVDDLQKTLQKYVKSIASGVGDVAIQMSKLTLYNALVQNLSTEWSASPEAVIRLTPYALDLCSFDSQSDPFDPVAKLVFGCSKDSVNDTLFCHIHLVESCISFFTRLPSPSSSNHLKTLVYLCGALKNVASASPQMLQLLATYGMIPTCCHLFQMTCPDNSSLVLQLLIQVTAILRHLSTVKTLSHKQLLSNDILPKLCALIPTYRDHAELMVNVSRIFGKLTLHERFRAQVNAHADMNLNTLLSLLDSTQTSWLVLETPSDESSSLSQQHSMILRLCFTMGNLCAGNERNRDILGAKLPTLLHLLQVYGGWYKDDESEEVDTIADVLVKLIRLLANLAMSSSIAISMNEQPEMDMCLQLMERTSHEELLLNLVSCVTNLSFYLPSTSPMPVTTYDFLRLSNRKRLIQYLPPLANFQEEKNPEIVTEALRALGNLSRGINYTTDSYSYEEMERPLHALLTALSSIDMNDDDTSEALLAALGVLMNCCLDESMNGIVWKWKKEEEGNGVLTILKQLASFVGNTDVPVVVCKVVWNLVNGGSLLTVKAHWGAFHEILQVLEHQVEGEEGHAVVQRIRSQLDQI